MKIVFTRFKSFLLAAIVMGAASEAARSQLPPLTTVPDSLRLPGKFVWADLVTDDVPATQKFYGALFGWSFSNHDGYVIGVNDDRPICGIFQRPRPAGQEKARPRWFGYISVANVDKARSEILKAGGRELAAPKKMPDRGEQAVFADPEGAIFGVIKSSSGDPEDYLADPGDWIWVQLLSHDARKASEFYRAVAGYDIIENGTTNRQNDYVLTSEGYARATVRTIRAAGTKVQPTWLPFVRVKSVAVTVALAKQLGGKVLAEPSPKLMDGKMAVIADPTGAGIGILEWAGEPPKGGNTP